MKSTQKTNESLEQDAANAICDIRDMMLSEKKAKEESDQVTDELIDGAFTLIKYIFWGTVFIVVFGFGAMILSGS